MFANWAAPRAHLSEEPVPPLWRRRICRQPAARNRAAPPTPDSTHHPRGAGALTGSASWGSHGPQPRPLLALHSATVRTRTALSSPPPPSRLPPPSLTPPTRGAPTVCATAGSPRPAGERELPRRAPHARASRSGVCLPICSCVGVGGGRTGAWGEAWVGGVGGCCPGDRTSTGHCGKALFSAPAVVCCLAPLTSDRRRASPSPSFRPTPLIGRVAQQVATWSTDSQLARTWLVSCLCCGPGRVAFAAATPPPSSTHRAPLGKPWGAESWNHLGANLPSPRRPPPPRPPPPPTSP